MKRITFVLASLLMLLGLKATAQNERVLLFECFTNTSCGPCASQNPALDALINNNGDCIAAIKYHMNWPGANDPMYLHNTVDNDARKGVYSVNSVPHTVVDGIRFANVPGNLNQNMVNNWLNITSPLEMRLSYELDENANIITVHVMGRATSAITGSCKLYVGVIEKEIHYTSAPGANGERDFYSVMKKLLPTASGTYIGDMAEGDYFAYTFTWEWANVYNVDQLDAIAWVQNQNSKEVFQACRSSQTIEPFYVNDAGVSNVTNVKSVNCSGNAQPKVTLGNFGSNPLTSAELEIVLNDEVLGTAQWNGNLPIFATETLELDNFSFPVEEENTLEVRIAKINGGDDEASSNNVASYQFRGAPLTVGKVLKLSIRTDNNPGQTTWALTNTLTGEVVQQGGPYDQTNHTYTETLEVTNDGCYDVTIFDAGGDGFADGNGFYGLKAGGTTLFSGSLFGYSESNEFLYEVSEDVEENLKETVSVYPNPVSGMLNIVCEGQQNVTLYNMSGQRVFEGVADGWLKIDTKPFGAGVYAVTVGDETMRIVVK
jgi:hypothetical protein